MNTFEAFSATCEEDNKQLQQGKQRKANEIQSYNIFGNAKGAHVAHAIESSNGSKGMMMCHQTPSRRQDAQSISKTFFKFITASLVWIRTKPTGTLINERNQNIVEIDLIDEAIAMHCFVKNKINLACFAETTGHFSRSGDLSGS